MIILALVIILAFGLGALAGAPWLPSRRQTAQAALDLAALAPGERLLDLGCGAGGLLLVAAKAGLDVTGIEINPLLWLVATVRLWPYRRRARVILGNFWTTTWPASDAIYVFLIGHYMARLAKQLPSQIKRPTVIISYTFAIPGLVPSQHHQGLYRYDFTPEN